MKVSTKFEVDTTIHCLVIALLLLIRYMTLWPWPLTLVSGHAWWVTWTTHPTSLKILWLSFMELWVLTSSIGYHWQCVCSHCACAVSRDLCIRGKFFPHFFAHAWKRNPLSGRVVVGIPNVITCTNFGDDSLRGLGWQGAKFCPFP